MLLRLLGIIFRQNALGFVHARIQKILILLGLFVPILLICEGPVVLYGLDLLHLA